MGDCRFVNSDITNIDNLPVSNSTLKVNQMFPREDYKYEKNRLATFLKWPQDAPVAADKVARAGFYYTGPGFTVKCFACKKSISEWDYNDQVLQKHMILSPECDFIIGRANNIPLVQQEIKSSRSAHCLARGTQSRGNDNLDGPPSGQRGNDNWKCNSSPGVEKTWDSFQSLLSEAKRLLTFRGWPNIWIKPEDLAKAGFFYLKDEDKVQCIFCKGIVSEWEEGDIPLMEHKRHFPSCRFILGLNVGNVPVGGEMIQNLNGHGALPSGGDVAGRYQYEMEMFSCPEKGHINDRYMDINLDDLGILRHKGPKHPNYSTSEARRRSFLHWPPSIPQNPEKLVEAGFYYAGVSDHVRCFYCDGGLRNWEPTDDPWVEHARWFDKCVFLNLLKGQEFIDRAKVLHPPVLESNCNVRNVTQEEIDSLMTSPIVEQVKELGVSPTVIFYALKKQLQSGGVPFQAPESLYEACLNIQTDLHHGSIGTVSEQSTSDLIHSTQIPINIGNRLVEQGSGSLTNSQSTPNIHSFMNGSNELEKKTEAMSLLEENQRLKEMQLCKICMEEEVGVVFLPCGHLITCPKCAPCVTECPVCRKPIAHTVRTFLS